MSCSFPSFLHLLTVAFNIYLLGLNALKPLFPKKMVPTHHNVAVLQITFGHCTMSAPTVQTLILKSLSLSFIKFTNGGFAGQMSFQERKIIFSSEIKWMTLFDPLNGP